MQNEKTDALAAVRAEQQIRDLLLDHVLVDEDGAEFVAPDSAARAVVATYTSRFEHRDGLRRVVLTSGWEVDPAAVKVPAAPALAGA